MILSRDLQEILEGVHYFLSETLSSEPLTGKVECLRRGLVLQLEALAITYPTLRIRARSSVSLPYLAMDQGPTQVIHRLSESLSSGSSGTNSYSNSSSGDGLVLGSGRGGCADRQPPSENLITQDEEYEDFQDNKETKSSYPNGVSKELDMTQDDADDNEDVYMDTIDAVPFSTIIATCDKHGVLAKKTKGLLRNLKSYHCVATHGMLYLYLKETDERQRKTIDLTGYMARLATGEDIRDQRKKDAAFEIVGPGKKTHTFIARTARDRAEWLAALGRTIKAGRSRTLPSMSSLSGILGSTSTDMKELILPSKAAALMQTIQKTSENIGEEDFYYHDVADDTKEDVYEVVGPEGTVFGVPVRNPDLQPVRPAPQPPNQTTDIEDYDPVSPEDVPPPLPDCPPPSTHTLSKRPPERPPLPVSLQNKFNLQTARPLPDAPQDANYNSYDPGGIYCEIEEDMLEIESENNTLLGESQRLSCESSDSSSHKAINPDSKKARAVSADGLPQDGGSMSPTLSSRASTNSLVGSFSEEILMNISDPNLSQHTSHKYSLRSLHYKTPPKLPPKGIPLPLMDDDDSEYKVPASSFMDPEYQIPPNPVPTDAEQETIHEISGNVSPSSQMYQVPPSHTIVPVQAKNSDKRNYVIEEKQKPESSFLSEKEETPAANKLKALAKKFETNKTLGVQDIKEKPTSHGTSVKDMIARLNKNKTTGDNESYIKAKEPTSQSEGNSKVQMENKTVKAESSCKLNSKEEIRLAKPNLPPRPQNLLNGSQVVSNKINLEDNKDSSEPTERADESDDDYYETPEGNSFDSTSQEINPTLVKDTTAPWRAKPELDAVPETATTGEWYVAKFAFVATIDQALSFSRGDLILVHDPASNSGWWKATVKGRTGVVPKEYLRKRES